MRYRFPMMAGGLVVAAALAACGGGGGGSSSPPAAPPPAPTQPPVSTQQVVSMALPTSAIGSINDPTYGLIGGYTQTTFSQSLAFAPGSQIMIRNGAVSTAHTLNVVSQTSFPANPTFSFTAVGGSTLAAGFASGNLNGGQTIGPITLTAGLYYIGCAYHYASNNMRTVLNVATGATPGPAATAPPGQAPPPPGGGGGYGA